MESFDAVYRRHYHELYRYVYRYLGRAECCEDVVQEAFLRLFRQRSKTMLDNERAWLYRVATNLSLTQLGRQKRWQGIAPKLGQTMESPMPPDEVLARTERAEATRSALGQLKNRDRVLLMLYQEEMSYKEIAEVTGIHVNSVGKLLSQGHGAMRPDSGECRMKTCPENQRLFGLSHGRITGFCTGVGGGAPWPPAHHAEKPWTG